MTATTSAIQAASAAMTASSATAPGKAAAPGLQLTGNAAAIQSYQQAIAALRPVWQPLPLSPYPPSGDTSNFPRTGSPLLVLSPTGITAAQRAEPGQITKNQLEISRARVPKLNGWFFVGAACLAGYFWMRK